MFINQKNNLVIPQKNHALLAGSISAYWGNDNFDLPKIPMSKVVAGIAFHQNGYADYDTNLVKATTSEQLVQILKDDFYVEFGDIDIELMSMFHQHRLTKGIVERKQLVIFRQLESEFGEAIEKKLKLSKFKRAEFEWVNRITHLCDKISFNFCIGNNVEEVVPLFQRVNSIETIDSSHKLINENTIELTPWPFLISFIRVVVVAYNKEDYPKKLNPVLLTLKLMPKSDL